MQIISNNPRIEISTRPRIYFKGVRLLKTNANNQNIKII